MLRLTTFARDLLCARCDRDTTSAKDVVLCTALCRCRDSERQTVSPTQSISEKHSELFQTRFGVLDTLPDDALHAEQLGCANILATVIDENNVLMGHVETH